MNSKQFRWDPWWNNWFSPFPIHRSTGVAVLPWIHSMRCCKQHLDISRDRQESGSVGWQGQEVCQFRLYRLGDPNGCIQI